MKVVIIKVQIKVSLNVDEISLFCEPLREMNTEKKRVFA